MILHLSVQPCVYERLRQERGMERRQEEERGMERRQEEERERGVGASKAAVPAVSKEI